ncbi:MAG: heavy metal translocating P-type ATPase [Tractidigestivibacter sp.]|jgi:heavy metal translocating P-type ATPase|uniref:heavy metal translocating P-type ATPase n=1 Tax=Tractidigestivibacter sp. TaxID=2847320 RepID=UPI003D8E06CF
MAKIREKIRGIVSDEAKFRIVRMVISAIALVVSLGRWATLPFGLDMAWIAIALCGVPIVVGAVKAVVTEHDITADVLVSLALVGSLIANEYFAAGEVALIMEIGSALEDYTAAKAKSGISKLVEMLPRQARVRRDGHELVVGAEEVRVGDTVVVHAGETIPVDGKITRGETSVDQSAMTGESLPVDKGVGDQVVSGTINGMGVFEYRATAEERDSSLQRMVRLAEEAEKSKAPIVSLADKWAAWLVIAAATAALVTFCVNWAVLGDTSAAFLRAVTVLVVVCPCAFVLATPTAVMAGIGNATRYGIIVKSGEALQRFGAIDLIAFDKTGTLTQGALKVSAVESLAPELGSDDVLRFAAAAESGSEHPIGRAIASECARRDLQVPAASGFRVLAGRGIAATCDGHEVLVGKPDLLAAEGVNLEPTASAWREGRGETIVLLAMDGQAVGRIALADMLRPEVPTAMKSLQTEGVKTVLLTGDAEVPARELARQAGVSEHISEMLPEDKQAQIKHYQQEGNKVCMIGDGVNDALALATADAAIAMGGIGSDVAIESSDAVLVKDDISRVPYLIDLSRRTLAKIRQNIIISLCINAVATALAATGVLDPVIGALVHNAGSVFVVLNSLFLLRGGKD